MTLISTAPPAITREEFRDISDLLRAQTGIWLAPGKESLVMGRLARRVRQLGMETYGEYIRRLRLPDSQDELRRAIDLLTTNETYFFRERQHFDFLSRTVLPNYQGRPFRLWSAASSSGEEAYTAAMTIADAIPDGAWEVLGTDVSSRVVQAAQQGIYPIVASEKIPAPLLRKYCRKGRDEYEGLMAISPDLRTRVTFLRANLLDDLRPLGMFDVILLRNVMIYFEPETRAALIGRIQDMLVPGGYLLVSHSETLSGMPSRLRVVRPSIYQLVGGE